MEQRSADSGNDLILDNRKLIIGFLLFIAVCGAFFVIGFMEGKRQVVALPTVPTASDAATANGGGTPGADAKSSHAATDVSPDKKDASVKDQLEWYKNLREGDAPAGRTAPVTEGSRPTTIIETKSPETATQKSDRAATAPETKIVVGAETKTNKTAEQVTGKPIVAREQGANATYSVQVGAFMQRREADIKAEALKAKGFTSIIEEPKPPDPYYRVKVGKYDVRAEAVAMQRKLTKAGFACIVKSN